MIAIAAAAGCSVAPSALGGDAGRLLITFLGLVSASILPTISLILGSMTGGSRSVKALNELAKELSVAIDALLLLFGLVALAVALLILLAFSLPSFITHLPYVGKMPDRLLQGGVFAIVALVVMRAGQIPGILRRSLALRHKIAVDEARRGTLERAPKSGAMAEAYANDPDFGKTVAFEGQQRRESH